VVGNNSGWRVSACTDFPEKIFPEISRTRKNIFRIFCEPPESFEIILKNRSAKKSKKFSHELFSQRFCGLLLFVKGWIFLTHPLGSGIERRVNGGFRNYIRNGSRADDRSDHRVEGAATQKTAA
jgi:hypothetical protein